MIKTAATFLLWIFMATIIFFSSFKEQIVVPHSIKKEVNIAFPEGWGFFTKNPRDLHLEIYKIEAGNIKSISICNHSLSNFLGLSRKSRVIGYEASMLANKVKKEQWKDSDGTSLEKFVYESIIEIQSISNFKYFTEGDYIIKLYEPIPYAWVKENQEEFNPYKIARIKVLPKQKNDNQNK